MQKFSKKHLPKFDVGDTVEVVVKIKEGDKERKQIFAGTIIAMRGYGLNATFTVRRVVQGEGVERIFPLHSTKVVTVKVLKKNQIRRAKLYYLRDRVGKATKLKERIWTAEEAKKSAKISEEAAKEIESLKEE